MHNLMEYINKLESKTWITESEKIKVIEWYHRKKYCNNDCILYRLNIESGKNNCKDNFNNIIIKESLINKTYKQIKEELEDQEKIKLC